MQLQGLLFRHVDRFEDADALHTVGQHAEEPLHHGQGERFLGGVHRGIVVSEESPVPFAVEDAVFRGVVFPVDGPERGNRAVEPVNGERVKRLPRAETDNLFIECQIHLIILVYLLLLFC